MNSLRPTLLRFATKSGGSLRTTAAGSTSSNFVSTTTTSSSGGARRGVHIEKRLEEELGLELPPAPTPKANYNIVCHASGNMLYVSGHLPVQLDGSLMKGRIGPKSGGESVEHGYAAARQCGLNIVSTLKEQLGDLDRVEKVVKVRVCVCVVSERFFV